MGIFDAFSVHNPKKHADTGSGYQGSKNSTGSGTMFMYAKEYKEPSNADKVIKAQGMSNDPEAFNKMMMQDDKMNRDNGNLLVRDDEYMGKMNEAGGIPAQDRRGSDASMDSQGSSTIDWQHMSQNEFKKMYDSMRKGEPNNRVNY
ncbi:hypothetical protein ACO0QE_002103 [Hanseniaspora vineae]